MFSFDSPTGTVPLKFKNKDKKEELVNYLQKEHEQAFRDRAGLEKKWKLWLDQYNSRRKREGAKPRDSQIDLPFTQRRTARSIAGLINPVFQQDQLMVAHPASPQYDEFAMALEPFMEYITNKVDLRCVFEDWLEQAHIFNFGALKTPFVRKVKYVKQWTEIDIDQYEELKALNDTMPKGERKYNIQKREFRDENVPSKFFLEEDLEVTTFEGAEPSVVPIEDFICPITTADVESADWITHRLWLTKAQIEERIRKGIYEEKDGDEKILDVLGNPYSERKKIQDYTTTQDGEEGESSPSSKQYEIMETYLSYDCVGDGKRREIVITWDRKSGVFLRAIDNPFHNFCRPFVVHHFKRVHGSIFGIPATFMLEPLHVANSASYNQRLDAASKANETILCMPPGAAPKMKSVFSQQGVTGGLYEVSANKDEVWQFPLAQPFNQLPQLEEKLEYMGDDLMYLSEYSRGNEQIQRPTATGQVSIIEEAKQPTFTQLERFRKSVATVILHMVSRYRQFYPEGMTYYVQSLDPQRARALEMVVLNWPEEAIEESVIVETKVTSAQMSKNLRKQEIVALLDRIPQIYQTMMQMAGAAMSGGPESLLAVKMLHGMQTVVDRFLTEFEVPKKDQLNPDLVQEAQVAQNLQQNIQRLQSTIQQLQSRLQQVTGGGPGGPGAGMGTPPGGPGAPQGVPGPPNMGGPPAGPVPQ